jgi:hypothetical protein
LASPAIPIVPEKKNELTAYYYIAYKQQILVTDEVKAAKVEPYHVQLFYMRSIIEALEEFVRTKSNDTKNKN